MNKKLMKIHEYLIDKGADEETLLEWDSSSVYLAMEIMEYAHRNQKRENGEDYAEHPSRVLENYRKLVGIKPDMHKSVKFDYDTILEFYKEENGEDVRYFAKVKKDRTNVTKVGQIIENPSYDIWKDYFESMNGLDTNETTYKQDIKTSTESMVDQAEKAEELAAEFKDVLKSLKENKDALLKVNKLMKEKEVDLKKLEMQTPETLTELIDFAKLQLS